MDFRVGDAQSLPFGDREFDVAAMALVITFIPDPAKALAEMKRVVKPGGTIGTYVWDFTNGGSPQQPLREAIEAAGVTVTHMQGHENSRREALDRIFKAASLDDVATRMIEIDVSYSDFDAYWTSQTGARQHHRAISEIHARHGSRARQGVPARTPDDRSVRPDCLQGASQRRQRPRTELNGIKATWHRREHTAGGRRSDNPCQAWRPDPSGG